MSDGMNRAFKFTAALGTALGLLFLAPGAAVAGQSLTVVELFTSQGCSSCPPADKFLGELSRRGDVLALSLHVDYWDYIGWKDPFADPAYTRRQQDYKDTFRLKYVYTPQMVIQGRAQAVGSHRTDVNAAIRTAQGIKQIAVGLTHAGKNITVSIDDQPVGDTSADVADVLMVVFDRRHETAIRRGENRDLKLTNTNVVRSLRKIGIWNGTALSLSLPVSEALDMGGEVCGVLLQSQKTGFILGAARLALDGK
jgi:hypothetical protein